MNLFHTHPTLAERINRARTLKGKIGRGLFQLRGPSHSLFNDFVALSKKATELFYENDMGDDFQPARMVPTSLLVTDHSEIQLGESAMIGYFLGRLNNLRPLWIGPEDLEQSKDLTLQKKLNPQKSFTPDLLKELVDARDKLAELENSTSGYFHSFTLLDERLRNTIQSQALLKAHIFSETYPSSNFETGSIQIENQLKAIQNEKEILNTKLIDFDKAMRERLILALKILPIEEVKTKLIDASIFQLESERFLICLKSLHQLQKPMDELRLHYYSLATLIQSCQELEITEALLNAAHDYTLTISNELKSMEILVCEAEYPFSSPSSSNSLKEYLFETIPEIPDLQRFEVLAENTLGRYYALYFRIMGRLAMMAGRIEGVMGLGPLLLKQ